MMNKMYNPTERQLEATRVITSNTKTLVYGGGRSGKSFLIARLMIVRAAKTKSRHVCFRQRFNHVKSSLWYDTFPHVLHTCFPNLTVETNKTDYFIQLSNGSQIWFGGLDDKERTDKILGTEYSTIYFNEVSQITYNSVLTALTRLSENTTLVKRAIFDCNPPSKNHWSYKLFLMGLDPMSGKKIDTSKQGVIQMNPVHNAANLPEEYISETLEGLSEAARLRFLHGEYSDEMTGYEYYSSFSQIEHVSMCSYNPNLSLHLSFDQNVVPYTPAGVFQIEQTSAGYEVNMIDEIAMFHPHNTTEHVCREIMRRYGSHKAGTFIYGDATGQRRTGLTAATANHYQVVQQVLRPMLNNKSMRLSKTNEPNIKRRDFMNALFEGRLPITINISPKCKLTIDDFISVILGEDGKKKSEKDNGAEKYGHFSDLTEYFLVKCFEKIYQKTVNITLK